MWVRVDRLVAVGRPTVKLVFTSVSIKRFKSFDDQVTLDLSTIGLHFVRGRNEVEPRLGPNGAGKSSIFDALCWCLYGRTPSGLRNTDVKPWAGSGQTVVGIRLVVDGVERTVQRTAGPNSFAVDGTEVAYTDASTVIGLSYEVFINTVLLAQAQPLFFDLQPRDKMALFVDVLALDRWEALSDKAADRVKQLERAQSEAKGELLGSQDHLNRTETLLVQTQKRSGEWDTEHKAKIAAGRATLTTDTNLLAKIEPKLAAADILYDGAAMEWKGIDRTRTELRGKVSAARKPHQTALLAQGLIEHTIATLETTLAVDKPTKCPSCGQSLTKAALAMIEEHLAESRATLAKAKADSIANAKTINKAKANLDAAEKAETVFMASVAELERRMDEAGREVRVLQPEVERLRARMVQANDNLSRLEEETNPYRDPVTTYRKERDSLKIKIDDLTEELAKHERTIERTRFWVKGFKDVRLYVIGEVLAELELTTNALLEEVGLVGWSIVFAVEKETKSGTTSRGLSVLIQSPSSGSPARWEAWSGGEGQRLRLIGALALSEVLLNHAGVQTSLEVLDEPTRHLSGEGVRELVDYLATRAQQLGRATFYIDHNTIESMQFASTITVVKGTKGSTIV